MLFPKRASYFSMQSSYTHSSLSLSLMHTLVHKLCPHNTPFMTFPLRYSMHIIPLSMPDLTPFNVHYTLFSVQSSSLQCTIMHIIIASQCTIFMHTFSFISDVQSCVHLYSSMHISYATLFFNVHTQVHNPLCYAIVHLFPCAHSMHNPLQWVIHLHIFSILSLVHTLEHNLCALNSSYFKCVFPNYTFLRMLNAHAHSVLYFLLCFFLQVQFLFFMFFS